MKSRRWFHAPWQGPGLATQHYRGCFSNIFTTLFFVSHAPVKYHKLVLSCCFPGCAAQAAGLPLKRKLWECKVSEDALMPAGTLIGAAHFKAGQYLDITGKGFGLLLVYCRDAALSSTVVGGALPAHGDSICEPQH